MMVIEYAYDTERGYNRDVVALPEDADPIEYLAAFAKGARAFSGEDHNIRFLGERDDVRAYRYDCAFSFAADKEPETYHDTFLSPDPLVFLRDEWQKIVDRGRDPKTGFQLHHFSLLEVPLDAAL